MNTEHSLWSYRVCWWAEEVWEGHDEWTMICSISVMVYVCRNLSWLSCVKILRLKQLLSIPLLIRLWVSRILSQFCNDPNTTLCCCKNETSRPPWISVGRLGTRSIQCDTRSLPPSLQIQTQLLVCYTRHTHQEFQIIWDSLSCTVSGLICCTTLTQYLQAYTHSSCTSSNLHANTFPKLQARTDQWWEDHIRCTCA